MTQPYLSFVWKYVLIIRIVHFMSSSTDWFLRFLLSVCSDPFPGVPKMSSSSSSSKHWSPPTVPHDILGLGSGVNLFFWTPLPGTFLDSVWEGFCPECSDRRHPLFIMKRWSDNYTENVYDCRCDGRLKVKVQGSTRLPYTRIHMSGYRCNERLKP